MVVSARRARIGISIARWNRLHDGLLEALRGWHEEHPDTVGPDAARLRQSFTRQISRALVGAALESLIREGVIVREGSSLRLESHSPALSAEEAALWKSVQRHVSDLVLRPPVVTELAQRLHVDVRSLDAFLVRSVRRGQLVRLAPNRCFHPRAIAQLAYVAERLAGERESGLFDAKSYRDRSGLGRNLAIQVLEYFDAAGLTMHIGDERKVIGRAEGLFGKPLR